MISSALDPYSKERQIRQLKDSVYYSISSNASNKGHIKTFPLVVRHFSHEEGVCIKILSFYNSDSETYDSIVAGIKSELNKASLPLKNISSFCADSASVNFGKNKNIFVELRKENPNLISAACNCHLLNNATKQAANTLQIDVEAIVIKIYSEFHRSTKRVTLLKEFFAWMDIEWQEILKHVPTWWLSLAPAVEHVVKNFEPSKSYFISQKHTPKILRDFFKDELSLAYLGFLMNIDGYFASLNVKLQSDEVLITDLFYIMKHFRTSLKQRKEEQFYDSVASSVVSKSVNDDHVKTFKREVANYLPSAVNYLDKHFDFEENMYKAFKPFSLTEKQCSF